MTLQFLQLPASLALLGAALARPDVVQQAEALDPGETWRPLFFAMILLLRRRRT